MKKAVAKIHLFVLRKNTVVPTQWCACARNVICKPSALITAFQTSDTGQSCTKILLKHGASVSIVDCCCGCTPLHYAAGRGNARVMRALLDNGADPAALDKKGRSPFWHLVHSREVRRAVRSMREVAEAKAEIKAEKREKKNKKKKTYHEIKDPNHLLMAIFDELCDADNGATFAYKSWDSSSSSSSEEEEDDEDTSSYLSDTTSDDDDYDDDSELDSEDADDWDHIEYRDYVRRERRRDRWRKRLGSDYDSDYVYYADDI